MKKRGLRLLSICLALILLSIPLASAGLTAEGIEIQTEGIETFDGLKDLELELGGNAEDGKSESTGAIVLDGSAVDAALDPDLLSDGLLLDEDTSMQEEARPSDVLANSGDADDFVTVTHGELVSELNPSKRIFRPLCLKSYVGRSANVVIPDGIEYIYPNAFKGCSFITSITIPSSVRYIEHHAFSGCSQLQSIVIPGSVCSLGSYVFEDCTSLKSVTIDTGRRYDVTWAGVTADHLFKGCKSLTQIPRGFEFFYRDGQFENCTGLTNVVIPEGETSIAYYIFSGCTGLTNVSIPSTVRSIGPGAFSGCENLTAIHIPEGVTAIADYTFEDCKNLKEFIIPSSVTRIGGSAFSLCSSLERIDIPERVESIAGWAFRECVNLRNVTMPTKTIVKEDAFYNCPNLQTLTLWGEWDTSYAGFKGSKFLKEIVIPNGVKVISDQTFANCDHLEKIELPSDVNRIGSGAFKGCSALLVFRIPDKVTEIENNTFESCASLSSVALHEGVTAIAKEAFKNCGSLVEIDIPASVNTIGSGAFMNCAKLKKIDIHSKYVDIGDDAFKQVSSDVTFYTYCSNSAYKWLSEKGYSVVRAYHVPDPEDPSHCRDCGKLLIEPTAAPTTAPTAAPTTAPTAAPTTAPTTAPTAPPAVVPTAAPTAAPPAAGATGKCGDGVDYVLDADGLLTLSGSGGMWDSAYWAFDRGRVTRLTVAKGITAIGESAFAGFSSLTSVALPTSVTAVGDYAFQNCAALVKAELPAALKDIGDNAFAGCPSLTIQGYAGTTAQSFARAHGIPFASLGYAKPTKVKLSKTGTVKLKIGKTLTLKASFVPTYAKSKVTWKSSKKNVATVSSAGKVKAVGKGTAVITATTANGKKATVKVQVTAPAPTKVAITKGKSATLKVGKKLTLKARLTPTYAESKLTWSSGNKAVATVSSKGVVTAKKAGTAKITVKTANGKKATITIKVTR